MFENRPKTYYQDTLRQMLSALVERANKGSRKSKLVLRVLMTLVGATFLTACFSSDSKVEQPGSSGESPSPTPTESSKSNLVEEALMLYFYDKIQDIIPEMRGDIERLLPDQAFLEETAETLASISASLGNGQETSLELIDPITGEIVRVAVRIFPTVTNELVTKTTTTEPDVETFETVIDVDPDKEWGLLSDEERKVDMMHELIHVLQLHLAYRNAVASCQEGIGEQEKMLLFSMCYRELREGGKNYEIVPYIVTNLYYYQLPDNEKAQFQNIYRYYYDDFLEIFGSMLNENTTAQDLINSSGYQQYKQRIKTL